MLAENNNKIKVLEEVKKISANISYAKGVTLVNAKIAFPDEVKINETDTAGIGEAVALAKKSDVVIMVLGEHGMQSGEGRSRSRLDLPGLQQQMLEAVYAVNKNVVLVLMNGRPLAITWANENVPAILEAWQPGIQSGDAIAQILFGEYNPSGKLPMTFPRSVGQVPIYYNHYSTGRPGPKTEVFWSHYTDETNKPLYPFGYGLSYTKFDYSKLKIDDADPSKIKVSVSVKNSGKLSGEEIVQLYIRDMTASIVRPVKELKGFQKIKLDAGEVKQVDFLLTGAELGFYNSKGEFIVEPGVFKIMVGTNSEKGITGQFTKK